jgi:CHAT domain-containing protein/tetratricopeptide (TPR) repeat protein
MTVRLVSRALVVISLLMLTAGNWSREVYAQSADELASLEAQISQLYSEGKYAAAEPIAEKYVALARQRHGDSRAEYATAIGWLAHVYTAEGRHAEAEPLYSRTLVIYEKTLGPEHLDVAKVLSNLAELYRVQGRYAEAEPLQKRALAIDEKALGAEHPTVATSLDILAAVNYEQGRYAEAEPLYKRSLAIYEKAFGAEHPWVAVVLNNLALLYDNAGRYADAEALYKRALAVKEKALSPDDPKVAQTLNNLATLYLEQRRYAEAEPLYKRSLAIDEKAQGPDHLDVGIDLNNLASLYDAQGRYVEAEPLFERAIAIEEKVLGPEHPTVGQALNNLAAHYRTRGRYAEAELLYKRALAIKERALGAEHPFVATSLSHLAGLALAQRQWVQAADYGQRATKVIERRVERGLSGSEEAARNSRSFSGLVKVTDRIAPAGDADRTRQGAEMFEKAQWAHASEAGSSLTQMVARNAKGDTALAMLVRERQDLVGEWQVKDKQLIAAKSQESAKRNLDTEKVLNDRLAVIDGRLKAISAQFAKNFPEFASLTSPKPASVAEMQALLGLNEALVLFLDTDDSFKPTPEETFLWVITKGDMRWVKSELGTKALAERVAALRCGLDATLWDDGPAAARCRNLVNTAPERDEYGNVRYETLPIDTTQANVLYKALFEPIADVIRDKHLLIVPSGALTQLPFQVLITDKPDQALGGPETLRRAAWMIRRHALTVLPSASSLKALRQLAKQTHANRTLIGFGNPLLDGPDARYAALAAAARSETSCLAASKHRVAELTGKRRGVLPLTLRSGLAESAEIRSQVPLPETADELCAVARDLRVTEKDIWLANRATEAEIKRLSAAGELAKYRIVHFATHGALAGQIGTNSEPGLILTPPLTATEEDDGYLSASEITTLKLDADWVILSACNTAAGDAEGAEALSGLARAFFYAGARALLVSHWAVASDATVRLTTGAVERMAADKRIGRAEAMRQSMLALIDKGEPYEAHPAFWAPFVVVGEGGAER